MCREENMNTKNFMRLLTLALVLALLAACSSAVPEAPEDSVSTESPAQIDADEDANQEEEQEIEVSEPVVTISFWHTYNEESPENEMLTKTLIPLFEAEHPNIKVESLSVAYPDFRTKLMTAIAGGVAPDLIRADIIWVPELADMGALAALDELMPDFDDYTGKVFPGPLSTNYWNGHYYGLPLDTNTKVMLQNADVLASAGIDQPAATFDEFWSQCDAIKQVDDQAYLFAADGTFAWVMLPWIWSGGGEILDEDFTTAEGYLNGPDTVAVYEMWKEMYQQGCIAPIVLGEGIDTFTGVGQGIYAGFDNGPWTFPILEGQFEDVELVSSIFPAGKGGSVEVVGGEDVVLFEQSESKDAAVEFIRFLLSEEYQLKMAEVGQIPVLTSAINSDYMQEHPYYGIFLEQLSTAKARPAHPLWSQIDEIMTDAGQLILRDEMSVQEALDDAASQVDVLLGK